MNKVTKYHMNQATSLLGRGSAKAAPVHIAAPGAGATQTLADNGMSAPASVNGEEVMMKAFKDGFSLTGCYKDAMPEFYDKFGNNKDQYKGQMQDVSVVVYKEAVLKDEQLAMTPEVCFDFCRTIPQMGYFGIINGDYCYCTPYFKSAESGSEICDIPCVGAPSLMCGGKTKSSVFEMHLCNDAADDLEAAAEAAGNAMMNFYSAAWNMFYMGTGLTKSGDELQKLAGLGGDPLAADWGQTVKEKGGEIEHILWDGQCFESYEQMHKIYFDSEATMDKDFFVAANLEEADTATYEMTRLSKIVSECVAKAKTMVLAMEPWYDEKVSSWTDENGHWDWEKAKTWQGKLVDDARLSFQLYYPLSYAFSPSDPNSRSMSTCGGEQIGMPKSLKLTECALACDRTIYPTKCVGYQHFAFGGSWKSGWHSPICILLSKFTSVTTYPNCAFMKKKQPRKWTERWSRTPKPGPEAECDKVALYVFQMGRDCQSAFGWRSPILDKCKDECDKAKGTMVSATCDVNFAWLNGFKPDIPVKVNDRCFGGDENKFVDDHDDFMKNLKDWLPPEKGFSTHDLSSPWWPNRMWTEYEYYY